LSAAVTDNPGSCRVCVSVALEGHLLLPLLPVGKAWN
jgi:hypothetical protein